MLIHEYLRWKPKPKLVTAEAFAYDENYAMSILRRKGQQGYEEYLRLFEPEVEELLPKLLISKECPVLINAIKACGYDKKKIEDIAEFDGDDPIDGLRYIVDAAHNFVSTAVNEMENAQQQERILHQLQNTQDYTGYYRNMRALESGNKVKMIRRYR